MIKIESIKEGVKSPLLYIVVYLIPLSIYSQPVIKGQVYGSDNKPIAYASIGYYNNRVGCFTDSLGFFQLKKLVGDSIKISSIGFIYRNQRIFDTTEYLGIELKEDYHILNEITITLRHKTSNSIWIGHFKRKSNFFGLGGIGNQIQTAIYIPNEKRLSGYIDELHFKLEKYKNTSYLLRIRLFNVSEKSGLPDEDLLLSDNILNPDQLKRDMYFSVKSKSIEIPEEGFFVSFEWLPQKGITDEKESAPWIVGNLVSDRSFMCTNYKDMKWNPNLRPIINQEFASLNVEARIAY